MTHARNVWIAIALEALYTGLRGSGDTYSGNSWTRKDVVKYCLVDIVAKVTP